MEDPQFEIDLRAALSRRDPPADFAATVLSRLPAPTGTAAPAITLAPPASAAPGATRARAATLAPAPSAAPEAPIAPATTLAPAATTAPRRPLVMPWRHRPLWAATLAASLMLVAFSGYQYREYRRAVDAKHQLMFALQLTSQKLHVAHDKVNQRNQQP